MNSSTRRTKRLGKAAVIGAVLTASLLGVAGTASANGNVTWRNKATGNYLWAEQGAYPAPVGSGSGCGTYTYGCQWYDELQSDGTWFEASQQNNNQCLDSDNHWGNGGNTYTMDCSGNNNQRWYEIPTSNGWALQDKATGFYLDGGGGPEGIGAYTNGSYGLGNNYQHWT
ncbi:hypothetical protein ACFZB9_35605 [Kitasatospora sp. NPDC008050]|uniref:hypothetical protein n=1 Tax=Kitasatospora sp. NPDC008050 TaxID=3364021 RepID=UPI0036E69669